MEMMKKNETITSIELVKKINELREKEYQEKAKAGLLTEKETLSGRYAKLRHNDLLKIIRKEFKNKIAQGKISLSKYLDKNNREREMFELTLSQSKQVLLRESATVREKVIEYIEYLENQNRQLEELARLQARVLTKITRNIETLSLKTLLEYGKIKKERQKIYYIHYTNLARDIAGLPKGLKRDKLTQGQLGILQQVELIMTAAINECMSENIPFSLIYKEVKDRTEIKAKVLLKALQKVENVEKGITWKIEY
ncbi:hypothetical protein AB8B22_02340 [Leptotrichia sp. HSP-334]|jgi:hypothetical protein|uniref:Uncharacterized protein n=1 Tax=Leptotrichia rugosa TaxID=3239302 RepID=A0AB39VH69_9FUSO